MDEAETGTVGVKSLVSAVLDFIYPPVCQVCHNTFSSNNIWLCDDCRGRLEENPLPVCAICRSYMERTSGVCPHCRQKANLDWIYSLGPYEEGYAGLVKAVKYGPRPGLGKLLGRMLAARLGEIPHVESIDLICPVPLFHRKQAKRGFNQSALLALAIAEELQIECRDDVLIQTRANRDQIGLSVAERFENVCDVYTVDPDVEIEWRSALLVDDVTTSGATLNAAALALKAAGVSNVAAATVAVASDSALDYGIAYEYMLERS